jgi:hypothetical protein
VFFNEMTDTKLGEYFSELPVHLKKKALAISVVLAVAAVVHFLGELAKKAGVFLLIWFVA